ncbi:MAG TPA: J domain-containing protein [Candidatus Acidoferrales bacterium]
MALKTTDKPDAKPSAQPPLNPEEQELARKRAERAAIESELADRELRSANLRAELGAFEQQYLHYVGSRYAELDELKAGIAERLAKDQPANVRAREAANEARKHAQETKSAAGEQTDSAPPAFEASPEMKRLYRDVAKRIHPDLTSDRGDRAKRQILMAEANEAYQRGDETRLAKILTEYEWSPDAVQGEGAGAELVRVIRGISQARGRLAEIEAELQELLRSDLYQLKARVDEAQQHGRDVLKEMIEKVEDQIAQARRRLEATPSAGR